MVGFQLDLHKNRIWADSLNEAFVCAHFDLGNFYFIFLLVLDRLSDLHQILHRSSSGHAGKKLLKAFW